MNRTDLATAATTFAGQLARVTMTDGTNMVYVINGNVNSKGLVVRMHADEPVFYLAPSKIASVDSVEDADEDETDEDAPELHDGMTTRELADMLGTDPKSLRVILRSLNMGVGKGRKYSLSTGAYALVKTTIATADKA